MCVCTDGARCADLGFCAQDGPSGRQRNTGPKPTKCRCHGTLHPSQSAAWRCQRASLKTKET